MSRCDGEAGRGEFSQVGGAEDFYGWRSEAPNSLFENVRFVLCANPKKIIKRENTVKIVKIEDTPRAGEWSQVCRHNIRYK